MEPLDWPAIPPQGLTLYPLPAAHETPQTLGSEQLKTLSSQRIAIFRVVMEDHREAKGRARPVGKSSER